MFYGLPEALSQEEPRHLVLFPLYVTTLSPLALLTHLMTPSLLETRRARRRLGLLSHDHSHAHRW